MSRRKDYEPSIDFMCILHFFDDNRIIFIEYHDDVAFLLNKIFARLKWSYLKPTMLYIWLFNKLIRNPRNSYSTSYSR